MDMNEHEYDGITELDHGAPTWWQICFYASIAFGILYYIYYELGTGLSSDARLAAEITEIRKKQAISAGQVVVDEGALLKKAKDETVLTHGKGVFATNCASCHATDGGGLIGPNLTDRFWIHGKGTASDIYLVIKNGVPDKGMPAWGSMLSNDDLDGLTAVVLSFKGKTPKIAKEPQGIEVKE